MPKLAVIGGSNPHPENFGRRNWLGPYRWGIKSGNIILPGAAGIPAKPVYQLGPDPNEIWCDNGAKFWNTTTGQNGTIFNGEGVTWTTTSDAHQQDFTGAFVGCMPWDIDFSRDAYSQIIDSGNGITGISYDWKKYDWSNGEDHMINMHKISLMYRSSKYAYKFVDLTALHENGAVGDRYLFRAKKPTEANTMQGHFYQPLQPVHAPEHLKKNGVSHVCGIAFQLHKYKGGNWRPNTGFYMRIRNLRFHTKNNREIILPKKKKYPEYGQMPGNRYEFETY